MLALFGVVKRASKIGISSLSKAELPCSFKGEIRGRKNGGTRILFGHRY
jgi:hypothetical protein